MDTPFGDLWGQNQGWKGKRSGWSSVQEEAEIRRHSCPCASLGFGAVFGVAAAEMAAELWGGDTGAQGR